jgi:RNA polymerase sigma-70 factor (ECF subfamily)
MPPDDSPSTHPSIFLRLNASDPEPREIAWEDFSRRYGPVIAAFARWMGARGHDVDDVVQDVLMGFFAKSPTFVYDPSRGRFRGYLRVCAHRAICRRVGRGPKVKLLPLAALGEDAIEVEQAWDDLWHRQAVRRAMAKVRASRGRDTSWQAFEQTIVHGRPPQQVADELGISLSTVYKARERVSRAMREQLKRLEGEQG